MTLSSTVPQAGPTALVLFAALALAGCGAAAPPPSAESPALSTTEGSLAALDRAEGELMLALGGQASPLATGAPAAGQPAMQGGYAQPAPPPPPLADHPAEPMQTPGAAPGDDRGAKEAERSTISGGDPCASACRALGSMRRATDHLCALSGEGDTRCEGARRRVDSASARVHASCPACSAAGG
jgi:hypothetical protein